MVHSVSGKRSKHLIVIIFVIGVLLMLTACKEASKSNYTNIQTESFSISVPAQWDVETQPEVTFKDDSQVIGGVVITNYDPTQPISQFYGNHAEEISSQKIDSFSIPAVKVILQRSSPAAASVQTSSEELHYFFIPNNSKAAYDLNFDTTAVDSNTLEKIAKTFQLHNV